VQSLVFQLAAKGPPAYSFAYGRAGVEFPDDAQPFLQVRPPG
jgi:hypothetical protein